MKRALTLIELLVVIAIIAVLITLLMPSVSKPREGARGARCLTNLGQLSYAAFKYAEEHEGKLPTVSNWCGILCSKKYIDPNFTDCFICPVRPQQKCGYAMNKYLDGVNIEEVDNPAEVVLFFESNLGWNATGGQEALLPEPVHRKGYIVTFLDCRVEYIPKEKVAELTWKPVLKEKATKIQGLLKNAGD